MKLRNSSTELDLEYLWEVTGSSIDEEILSVPSASALTVVTLRHKSRHAADTIQNIGLDNYH